MAVDRAEHAGGVLEIDLAGIVANWRFLSRLVAPAECAAVVKADAYGLGAAPVARALAAAGCRRFFVATLDEGLALRAALPGPVEIAVFNGPAPGSAAEFAANGLVPVLNHPGQIAQWEHFAARHGSLPAMLHVDTGMARLGLTAPELERLADDLSCPGAISWRAVISHLACADEPEHPLNRQQRARFVAARSRLGDMPAESRGIVGDLPRPRVSFRFRPSGCGALRRQPAAGHAQPDARDRPARRENPANPRG